MKGENIKQLSFFKGRNESTINLVHENMNVLKELAGIIEQTKKDMEARVVSDAEPRLYEDKTYFAYTLTQLIKINIVSAIDRGELKLKKAHYYQCEYFILEGVMSIYIKKLSKEGLPAYNESQASRRRMLNDEKLPCLFLGPRYNDEGMVGGVCASITSGSSSSYWIAEIEPASKSQEKIEKIVYNDTNSDDICTAKEDMVKIKERKVN